MTKPQKPATCTLRELLEVVPLHSPRQIMELFKMMHIAILYPGEIWAHCDHSNCGGVRRHQLKDGENYRAGDLNYAFVRYECNNCSTRWKVFGLRLERADLMHQDGICTKIYQEPAFGEPVPKRLFEIIGEANREHFLQARRAIARGLGIGAWAYYRRIVENARFDLVGAVLKVAEGTGAPGDQVELLKKARSETQFSKAMEMLRDISAVPASLLVHGHNPLSLLHDLLSEGIHELDDAECLARAREAEIILGEIANKMQHALADRKSVTDALSSIMNRRKTAL